MRDSIAKTEKSLAEALTQKMLAINVAIVLAYAVIATATGVMVSSQTILAEGVSNLGAAPVAILNLFVVKFIAKRNAKKYPFGKETLEPFVGIPNNCFLLLICAAVVANSAQTLFAGGNDEIRLASSVLFGIFSVVFNAIVYAYFKSLAKKNPSPLVTATVIAWKFSAMVGVGIVLGFSLSWILSLTPLGGITPYVDPALAIVLMLVFASSPVVGIRDCMRELMQTSPPDDISCVIAGKIEQINADHDFSNAVLRMGKVGNKVIVEIDCVLKAGSRLDSVSEQDRLRGRFAQALAEIPYKIWLNVNFTGKMKWTEHIVPKTAFEGVAMGKK